MNKHLRKLGLSALALFAPVAAFAQTTPAAIDTTDVVATIGTGVTAIAAIGAAWLGFKYLKKIWNRI